jgi:hypothetical protein
VPKSAKASKSKRYGTSGQKLGHVHLKWALSKAAGLLLKHHAPAQKDLTKLATRPGKGKALSSRAPKLGRAVSCMLKHPVACAQEPCLAT